MATIRISPQGRIRNTRKLLATAGIIMSCMLLGSSIVTAMLIEPKALLTEGRRPIGHWRSWRMARRDIMINPLFGPVFGTIYDISTVAILWFAGASAMSGLLNLVPRYLPRFGMAPRWAEAVRWLGDSLHGHQPHRDVDLRRERHRAGRRIRHGRHGADVERRDRRGHRSVAKREAAPGGSGCTGVIVAAALVFFYTTVAIIIEKPDGIKIAGAFILGGAGVLDHLADAAEHGAAIR